MSLLHLEKKGLRGLAIAESFDKESDYSELSGVVMRGDFIVDGFIFGNTILKGDDATEKIIEMFTNLERKDVNYILISGAIISQYNIINLDSIYEKLKIPIISLSYHESSGLEDTLKENFPSDFKDKIENYKKLGPREKIILKTNQTVFVRFRGCTKNEVVHLLNKITLQGGHPEPIRLAKLLSSSMLKNKKIKA